MKLWLWRFLLRHDPVDPGYQLLLEMGDTMWIDRGEGMVLFAWETFGDVIDGKVCFHR